MNEISTVVRKSENVSEAHLDLLIDGIALAQTIRQYLTVDSGLVPCLLPWMDSLAEVEVVRSRFFPSEGAVANAPVLMCPDDLDFWCTIIIAKIEHRQDCISWSAIGLNRSEPNPPDAIGCEVEWSPSFAGWRFSKDAYRKVFEEFVGQNHS
jgi:hypothetical protein